MSDKPGRRALQKAATRERIRRTAQSLFADHGFDPVTIAGVAGSAGVSVQTVFNHFASKEELFFADRASFVQGPAAAVRDRAHGVPPLTALRHHLVGMAGRYARRASSAEHRRLIAVLSASPTLLAHERGLHEEAVTRLGAALHESWGPASDDRPGADGRDADGRGADGPGADGTVEGSVGASMIDRVTAAVWLSALRAVLLDLRERPPAAGDDAAVRAATDLAGRVFGDLEHGLSMTPPASGHRVRRAG